MSAVSEIMSKGVVTLDGDVNPSALNAVKAMVKDKVSSVVVVKGGRPAGIITERDVLKKVASYNKRPEDVRALDIMSSPLITIKAFDSVDTAASVMTTNRIKRLPVLEADNSLAGMISVSDIAKRLAKIVVDDYNRYRSLKVMLEL